MVGIQSRENEGPLPPKRGRRPNPFLIGLTGPYCAGKNYVAQILEKRGLLVLDVDRLGHQVLEEEKERIAHLFGPSVLDATGRLNRKELGRIVFGNPEKLRSLEAIVHPRANERTLEWIEQHSARPLVINAALLHRSIVFDKLAFIILVTAPWPIRLFRGIRRDHISLPQAFLRIWQQRTFFTQYTNKNTDIYVVSNPGIGRKKENSYQLENRIERILVREGIV
ncbi:MAG: dephospho-CoA kinase [Treponemataceae bacterium]|nr:dephospho-CoA kinase [Treponemataceae bacterium]